MTRSNSLTASILPARLVLLSFTETDAATAETSALGEVLWYPTTGCGGAIVHTALPGKQFTDTQRAMHAGLSSLHETAAALHVTWETSVVCTPSGRTHGLKPESARGAASAASTLPQPIFANRTDDISEVQADGVVNGYNSTNWSGYQINNTGQYVQGGWTVPTASKSNPNWSNAGYFSFTWSGIGGGVGASTTAPLIQAGTEQDLSNGNVASYYFWYEIVKGPTDTTSALQLSSPAARPGDSVAGGAVWTPSQAKGVAPGYATLGICNFTLNNCVNMQINATPAPGNSIEWIMEAPSENGGVLPLTNFTSVSFVNACWASTWVPGGSNTCLPIPQGSALTTIQLFQIAFGVRQLLAAPGAITSGTNFTDVYFAPERNN